MSKRYAETPSSSYSRPGDRSRTDAESLTNRENRERIWRSRDRNTENATSPSEAEHAKPWQPGANYGRTLPTKRRHVEKACPCGRTYQARADRAAVAKYCSLACVARFGRRPDRRGARNPNWKGGISKDNMRYKLRFAAKNPEKVKAHRIVASAKRRGDLVPGPCIRCGADNAHAHHEDYSKPLEVTWLCRRCHNQEHSGPRKTAWGKPATKNGGKKRAPGQFYWRGKLRYASPTPGPVRR